MSERLRLLKLDEEENSSAYLLDMSGPKDVIFKWLRGGVCGV